MKSLVWILRVICVAVGLVAKTLDTGPDLGRRALLLGVGVGFLTWLFDSRKLDWVQHLVNEMGLARFRRIFSVLALVNLAVGALLTFNLEAKTQSDALYLYAGAVIVSGLALTSFMIFLRLKRMERAARPGRG